MPKLNERYFNEYLKRQLVFEDFSTAKIKRIRKIIKKLELETVQEMVKMYSLNGRLSIKGKRLFKEKLKIFDAIYNRSFLNVRKEIEKDIFHLGRSEYEFHKSFFKEYLGFPVSLTLPSVSQLQVLALNNPVLGKPFYYKRISDRGSWLTDLNKEQLDKFKLKITGSFINGEGLGKAIKNIRGTKALNYTDGVFRATLNNTEAVVRTGYRSIQIQAQDIVLNSIGASKVRYTAVLDGRTTAECGQRDGNIYKYENRPSIPAHMRCRSTYVSVFDFNLIGDRITVSDTRTYRARNIDFRKDARKLIGSKKWLKLGKTQRNNLIKNQRKLWAEKNIGRVPIKTTYANWFDKQSEAFKRHKLGRAKFDLYKKGGLKYNQLVSSDLKFFTVNQLNAEYKILKRK